MINASIITIGDELLIGQVIDTNSAWIAKQLNLAGIHLRRRVAVGDVWGEITAALDREKADCNIILITGGLGPTADDITKQVLCEYFNGKMITHEASLAHIKHLFETIYKRPLTDRNLLQAQVPDTCKVILNKRGSAPGMWFEKDGIVFISMPGVPFEMKGMMEESVIPELIEYFKVPYITHRTLMTVGVGESIIADMISELENRLPAHIRLAYLPNFSIVRLRLTGTSSNKESLDKEIDGFFNELQQLVKEYLVTNEDQSMEQVVANMLKSRNQTVSTAESCTGGYIAHLLTSIPGASAFFEGSIISYSYEAKENLLQVNHNDLSQNGAVSEKIVQEMAKGIFNKLSADYTISVSGIMGPAGGLPDKPVGTVWIAVGNRAEIITKKFKLRFDRITNIQVTAMFALNMLREFILQTDQVTQPG